MTKILVDREVLQAAVDAANSAEVVCDDFHHKKSDQHHYSDVCKPLIRFEVAFDNLRALLNQPDAPMVEPVAWMDANGNISDNNDYKTFNIPLYTAPQERKPLSDEEIEQAVKTKGVSWTGDGQPTRRVAMLMANVTELDAAMKETP